jgi:hypothetical protein
MDPKPTIAASGKASGAAACGRYAATLCSAPPFVRIGPKGRHLAIPDGYTKIEDGEAQAGDLFANLMTGQWSPVDHADIGDHAINFDYLIRRQNPAHLARPTDEPSTTEARKPL